MLVEHRIDDVDERLVAIEQAMPAGEQIALQPAFALMLAEHFHHASARREKLVGRHGRRVPLALGHLEERRQTVGDRLVGAEHAEIPLVVVQLRDVAQEGSEHMRIADAGRRGRRHVDRIVTEIRHPQVVE